MFAVSSYAHVAGMVLAIRYIREGSSNRFKLPCVQDELQSHTSKIFMWLPFTVASAHEICTQWDVPQASTYMHGLSCLIAIVSFGRHAGLQGIFQHCLPQL